MPAEPEKSPEMDLPAAAGPADMPEASAERTEPSAAPPEPEFAGSAVSRAVNEVTQVAEALRQALAQMEEILELVELAERQKLGDEREIDSLRRALRRIHHPRGDSRERPPED